MKDITVPGLDTHKEQIDQVFGEIFPSQKDYEPIEVKKGQIFI